MSLAASLANYDINSLSSEMEKLGGGINIKRETNLAKFTIDPHRQQSYSKKEQRDTRELEKTLKQEKLSYSGNVHECAEEMFEAHEIVEALLGKGFNVNIMNFSSDSLVFDRESEFITSTLTNIQNCRLDYHIRLSLFRISYDAESNQEFYLDLLNLDYANPTANNLRDINLVEVSNADELRKLLSVAYETDFNFRDNKYRRVFEVGKANNERVFSCHVMNLTLYDEDKRYFSNLMITDCDVVQSYNQEATRDFTQRFLTDLKLIVKEASQMKLINIDTVITHLRSRRLEKRQEYLRFFSQFRAKCMEFESYFIDFRKVDYEIIDLFTKFLSFEVICYRSKNIANSFLSTGTNLYQFEKFIKTIQKQKRGTLQARSPLKNHKESIKATAASHHKKEENGAGHRSGVLKDSPLDEVFEDLGMERLHESVGFRKALESSKGGKSIRSPIRSPKGAISMDMLEEDEDIAEGRLKNRPPRVMKYDLKTSYGGREPQSPGAIEFQKNYIQYKKVHEENTAARKEILKENERLEAEIVNIKANYEKEIEGYRQNLLEMNTKLHILLDQEKDDRFRVIIEAYEGDLTRLELQNRNLREQNSVLVYLNRQQEMLEGGLDLDGSNKLKEMIKVLNLDLINKENIISKYKYQERERENKAFLQEKSKEDNKSLLHENKKLNNENSKLVQQLKDLTEIYDSLKKKNAEIYTQMQDQYMTSLHITEENKILKDLVKSKKIDLPNMSTEMEGSQQGGGASKRHFVGKNADKKLEAFTNVALELKDVIEANIKLESKRPTHLVDKLECLYNELNIRFEEMVPKQQKYLDFLGDLQIKMEEYLGKGDDLVKKSNKEIRSFLAEVLG